MTPKDLPRAALEALLEQARAGMPLAESCRVAGVRKPTVHEWLSCGDDAAQDVQDFRLLYETATAERIRVLIDAMTSHAQHDWRAALAELKRHLPEVYGDGVSHADRAEMMVLARRVKRAEAEAAEYKARLAALAVDKKTPRKAP